MVFRPTLKDVAERSGFALRTVIKVMNGDPSVRDKNREQILRTAEELGYTPNRAASALGKRKVVRLAVVYSITSHVYFPEIRRGLEQAAAELFDYGLVLEFHTTQDGDLDAQKGILEELAAREDLDGIVMQPRSATRFDAQINALVSSGKPVGIFGTDAPNSKRLFYVSCDGYRAGRIGGQMLEREIPRGGSVLVINSTSDQQQIVDRAEGCVARIRQSRPDIQIHRNLIECEPGVITIHNFADMLRELIASSPVDGIFCDDAKVSIAAEVLKSLGRRDVALVGFDPSEQSIALMREGYINTLLDQRPETFSYQAVKLLFAYLTEGVLPAPVNHTPIYIVTSECLDPA